MKGSEPGAGGKARLRRTEGNSEQFPNSLSQIKSNYLAAVFRFHAKKLV
jgi:hypothetical protein